MDRKFAIVGCGRIAHRHAEQIKKIGQLVAVCDIIEEKANQFASAFTARAYYSLETLLANETELDLVSVCTPNGLHALHSIQSLKAGIHVLCEKPLCTSTEDAREMIEVAKVADRKLFIVKSTRYNPVVAAVKNLLNKNSLGRIYSYQLNCVWNRPGSYYENSWRGSLEMDGGTLFTQFSHYIDVVTWFFGEPVQMEGYRTNMAHRGSIEFEDCGVISVETSQGVLGAIHYSVNAFQKNQEVSLTVVGEKGSIKLGGEFMNELLYQQPALINIAALTAGNGANDYGSYMGSMSNHDKVYENVAKALAGEKCDVTDGEEAFKTVSFIESFYKKTPVKLFPA